MNTNLFNALVYTFGNAWTTLLGAAATLVVRGLVLPEAFGATSAVQGIVRYFGAYNVIFRNALSQTVPAHLATGRHDHAAAVARNAYTMLLGSLVVESGVLLAFGLLTGDLLLKLAALTGVLLNVADSLSIQDRILLQATRRFLPLAAGHLLTGVLAPGLLILLSWWGGAVGYFVGLAVAGALRFAVYRFLLRRDSMTLVTRRLQAGVITELFTAGGGIALLTLSAQVLLTVDRWVILHDLGTKALGFYSLGSAMVGALVLIPVSIAGSYFPTMMGLVATGRVEAAGRGTRRVQTTVTLCSVVAFGMLALITGPAISALLPSYQPAILALQILTIQGYFSGTVTVASQVHIAHSRVPRAVAVTTACAALALALNVWLVRFDLVGVAVAMSSAWGAYALFINWSAGLLIDSLNLVSYALVGGALMGGLLATLRLAGPIQAWVYLFAVAGSAAWYLTRLLEINWRTVPSSARAYLHAGSRR